MTPHSIEGRTVAELAIAVNAWCAEHAVEPMSGQTGEEVNERSIRYYRTLGLIDGPDGRPAGRGYGEKHFLQLAAIRVLQAQGLPLRKIQELLYGRTVADLREIQRRGAREMPVARRGQAAGFAAFEQWQVLGLTEDFALVSRSGAAPSRDQLEAIRRILAGEQEEANLPNERPPRRPKI